jgi:hypothetical protein
MKFRKRDGVPEKSRVLLAQERGLFRADYEGTTLRDHLGLQRPKNVFFDS